MRTMRRICAAILVALLALVILTPAAAWADDGDVTTVRVGYYENEVFEEGAQEGAVKTGYAYEYYLAVTANAFVEDRDSALGVGMDAHLAKPYDIPKMMQTIGEVLAR